MICMTSRQASKRVTRSWARRNLPTDSPVDIISREKECIVGIECDKKFETIRYKYLGWRSTVIASYLPLYKHIRTTSPPEHSFYSLIFVVAGSYDFVLNISIMYQLLSIIRKC